MGGIKGKGINGFHIGSFCVLVISVSMFWLSLAIQWHPLEALLSKVFSLHIINHATSTFFELTLYVIVFTFIQFLFYAFTTVRMFDKTDSSKFESLWRSNCHQTLNISLFALSFLCAAVLCWNLFLILTEYAIYQQFDVVISSIANSFIHLLSLELLVYYFLLVDLVLLAIVSLYIKHANGSEEKMLFLGQKIAAFKWSIAFGIIAVVIQNLLISLDEVSHSRFVTDSNLHPSGFGILVALIILQIGYFFVYTISNQNPAEPVSETPSGDITGDMKSNQ